MADQDFQIKIRTTADNSGIRQTQAELDSLKQKAAAPVAPGAAQAAAQRDAEQSANIVGQLIGRLAGAGVIYGLINNISEVAGQIQQISKGLDEIGAKLVENAEKYTEQARAATSEADVIKVAKSALGDVESAHRRVIDAQGQELDFYHKITDSVYHGVIQLGLMGRAADEAGRISKHALDLAIEGQRQLESIADQNARAAIRTGKAYEEAFERRKAEPFAQAISELTTEIDQLRQKQNNLDASSKEYVKNWIDAGSKIAEAEKQLRAITQLQTQAAGAADKALVGASPQVQHIIANQQAAEQARKEGRDQDAEMFEKSQKAFEAGANPQQLAELGQIRKLTGAAGQGPKPEEIVGRKADTGESQEAVNQIERNRLAFEKQQYETGTGGPSLIGPDAKKARKDQIDRTREDSRAAEIERKTQNANTGRQGESSQRDRMGELIDLMRQQLGIWR